MAELWELRGTYWRLPIHVSFGSEAALKINLPTIPLLQKQRQAIEASLDAAAVNRNEDGWWVERSTLARIAEPTQDEPEEVVHWSPADNVMAPDIEFDSCMDGFFESLAQSGWTMSAEAARIQFRAFCQHMLSWMLERGRTVDLLFTRLMPCPLRSNWKDIVFNRHASWKRDQKKLPSVKSAAAALIERHCQNERCMAVDPLSKTPLWSIEVIPGKLWFRTVSKLQERRRRNLGSVKAFWNRFGEQVREFSSLARDIYARYLYEMHLPFITLPLRPWYELVAAEQRPEVGVLQSNVQVPLGPAAIYTPTVRYGYSNHTKPGGDSSEDYFYHVGQKDELVPSLSGLRKRVINLRKFVRTGGRLPLLHAPQSQTAGSPVLGGGEPTEPLGGSRTDREPARLEGTLT